MALVVAPLRFPFEDSSSTSDSSASGSDNSATFCFLEGDSESEPKIGKTDT